VTPRSEIDISPRSRSSSVGGPLALLGKIRLGMEIGALGRRNRWSRERLLAHQSRALARLRAHAMARSPFYRSFHQGLADAPLERLPILTKGMVIDRFDDLVTDRAIHRADVAAFAATMSVTDLFRGRYQVVATSGTTGERGYFLFSRAEWRTLALAGVARGLAWAGSDPLARGRGAVMSTTLPFHMTARAGAELRRLGIDAGRLVFDAAEPVDALVARLNAFQPTMMLVYPSVMRVLAAEQAAGRLHIAPRQIRCTSEVLTDETRSAIADAFRVAPSNLYAASECGCIAASCGHGGGLHLSEDLVLVEIVDEDGRPVPSGETGARTLITVLAGRTMPLIRYEISDRLTGDPQPCSCGMPYRRIAAVAGRSGDMLAFDRKDGGTREFAPAQIAAAFRDFPVTGWQLTLSPGRILVECVVPAGDLPAAAIASRLNALFAEAGVVAPPVAVERIDRLARGVTGKSRLVTRIAR
jgi:putative adenylate-forming enzyme